MNFLDHPFCDLICQSPDFSLHLFRGEFPAAQELTHDSDQFGIFVCLKGLLISRTEKLAYTLSSGNLSFALGHRCRKVIPAQTGIEVLVLQFSRKALKDFIDTAGREGQGYHGELPDFNRFNECQCTVRTCTRDIGDDLVRLNAEAGGNYWGRERALELIFQEILIKFTRLFAIPGSSQAGSAILPGEGGSPQVDETLLGTSPDPLVTEARRILERDYRLKVSMDDLARETGVSKGHLSRVFKAATGQSPINFLNRVRVEAACRMLLEKQVPVEEASAACGFNSPNHFFKIFRDITGESPGQWRRNRSFLQRG